MFNHFVVKRLVRGRQGMKPNKTGFNKFKSNLFQPLKRHGNGRGVYSFIGHYFHSPDQSTCSFTTQQFHLILITNHNGFKFLRYTNLNLFHF